MRWLIAGPAALKIAFLLLVSALIYAGYVFALFSVSDSTADSPETDSVAAATVEAVAPAPVGLPPTPAPVAAAPPPQSAPTAAPHTPTLVVATAIPAATLTPAATSTTTTAAVLAAATTPAVTPTAIVLPRPQPTQTAEPVVGGLKIGATPGSGLYVDIKRADGSPVSGSAVTVFKQVTDVSGNATFGDRVAGDSTASNTGRASFDLPPGVYALRVDGLAGYTFGRPFDISVSPGAASVVTVTLGRLSVGIADADGKPVNHQVAVLLQSPDVNGNPVTTDRAASSDTGRTGIATFDLTAGVYAISIDGLAGYAWGNPFNYSVSAGQTNQVLVRLGRILVGTTNAQDQPESRRVQIVTLQPDVNGRPAADRAVASDTTSKATGLASFELTSGLYAVAVEGYQPKLITVQPGKIQTLKLSPATP